MYELFFASYTFILDNAIMTRKFVQNEIAVCGLVSYLQNSFLFVILSCFISEIDYLPNLAVHIFVFLSLNVIVWFSRFGKSGLSSLEYGIYWRSTFLGKLNFVP